ncbi:ribonuclease HII [Aerococcaceae bacterium DSM 111176]|nr:ribonuclease HII [Aerococcaceae bacterium DSM 111176]
MKPLTIKEIKAQLAAIETLDDPLFETFKEDSRKGVQTAIKVRAKQIQKRHDLIAAHHQKLSYERHLKSQGVKYIAGLDEVGRGPLAGPVVAATVILPDNCDALLGVNDSKQLSHELRLTFAELIKEVALDYGIGVVEAAEIDRFNIYQATKIAMERSIEALSFKPNYLLIDAMELQNGIPQQSIIKGDANSLSIAAASILAKVYRDELMIQYHESYPEYGFKSNMGYGTREHLDGLENYGYLPIHRQSFKPVPSMQPRKI